MSAAGASILVVSPDSELCDVVLRWASTLQVPATSANSGAEAIEQVLAGRAGLIFYNLRTDHLADLGAFARLRELPGGRDLPVVALVARAELGAARQYGQALGIQEYLTTPPSPVDLARQLGSMRAAPKREPPAEPKAEYPNYSGPLTLDELRDVHCQMGAMSHFERLGIGEDADTRRVRAAYDRIEKRYRVANLRALADDEARHLCRDIHDLLGEAYAVLRDPGRRTRYEASRKPNGTDEQPAQRRGRARAAEEDRPLHRPRRQPPPEPEKAEPEDAASRAAAEALAALEEAEREQSAKPIPAPAPEPSPVVAPEPAPAPPPPAPSPAVATPPPEEPPPEPAEEHDPFALPEAGGDENAAAVPSFDDDVFVFDLPDEGGDEVSSPVEPSAPPTREPPAPPEDEEVAVFNPALAAAQAKQRRPTAAAPVEQGPEQAPVSEPKRERRPPDQVLAQSLDDVAATAYMLALMGRYDAAVPLYERCYQASPSARLRYDLELSRGRLAAVNGDQEAARAHLSAALESAPRGRTEAADELEDLGGRKRGRLSRFFKKE